MKLYKIENGILKESNGSLNINDTNIIIVSNSEEYSNISEKYNNLEINRRSKSYDCTQIEIHSSYIYSAFFVPSKINAVKRNAFDCIILKNQIIFVDDSDYIEKIISNVYKKSDNNNYTIGKFFYEVLNQVINKDLIFLDEYDEKLYKLEDEILNNNFEKFTQKLSEIKRHLMVYYRHYSQLLILCDSLKEAENSFFNQEEMTHFNLFAQRVERLKEESQLLREYTIQIQDMYQAQIGVRQNDIMKTLTIVTTIVLPLSLLAGWYGMNFKYMPELNTRYGYFVIIAVSIVIVIASLILFKKKKYF